MSQFEIWIDGRKVQGHEATISVLDRGFLYGDSVFETLRTYGKRLFALDEHVERLSNSARQVFIPLPLAEGELQALLERTVAESSYSECYVRVMVTRGRAALGLDPKSAVEPRLVIILAQLVPPPEQDYREGIRAISFQTSRIADHTSASGAKLGNYLVAVLAQKKASEADAKEALIVSASGEVIEGATSNLFWIKDDVLATVPVGAGILPGITRAHLLRLAPGLGWTISFEVPRLSELLESRAVFISSSIRELVSVVAIDGQAVGDGRVLPAVRDLHQAFVAHARASFFTPTDVVRRSLDPK